MKTETPKHMCLEINVHIQWAQSRDPLLEEVLWSEREANCADSSVHQKGYYITDNPKMMATRVMQSDPTPKMDIFAGKSKL